MSKAPGGACRGPRGLMRGRRRSIVVRGGFETRPRGNGYRAADRRPALAGLKPAPTTIVRLLVLLGLLTACAGSPTATPIPPTSPPSATTATPTAVRYRDDTRYHRWHELPATAPATTVVPPSATPDTASCAPGVDFLGFADGLDKVRFGDTDVGGLSALAYDATRGVYYALTDNQGDTAARFYTLRFPLDGGRLGDTHD